MTWFKVDDTLAGHPKARQAGLAAIGLWTAAGSWSSQQLEDGRVPAWYVDTWPQGRKLAAALVKAKLWHAPGHDCDECPGVGDGWVFHDWGQANPFRAEVIEERDRKRAAGKLGGLASASKRKAAASARATPRAEPAGGVLLAEVPNPRPDPTRPVPSSGHLEGGASLDVPRELPAPQRPPEQCEKHDGDEHPPPCGACGDARRTAQRWDTEQAERRAQVAAELEAARADPRNRCEHGTDGGKVKHPDTGKPLCALCRAQEVAS